MENSGELNGRHFKTINNGFKNNAANASRVDNLVVCKANRSLVGRVLVEPVTMWGHVRCCTAVCIPIYLCIEFERCERVRRVNR